MVPEGQKVLDPIGSDLNQDYDQEIMHHNSTELLRKNRISNLFSLTIQTDHDQYYGTKKPLKILVYLILSTQKNNTVKTFAF
jgi:hypothetical protein